MTEAERRILNDPRFRELIGKRRRLTVWLTGLPVAAYTAFCFAAVWAPEWLGMPMGAGSVLTAGIVIAYLIIGVSICSAGYYVYRANTDLDALQQALRDGTPE